jgi:hypothetical protein
MKFFKNIISISCVTALALLYVHQQVELVKISYAIENREKKLKDVLDHNESLGYNIGNLESPFRLEQALIARNIDVGFPGRGNVVKVARLTRAVNHREAYVNAVGSEKGFSLLGLFEFISPAREAQAGEK